MVPFLTFYRCYRRLTRCYKASNIFIYETNRKVKKQKIEKVKSFLTHIVLLGAVLIPAVFGQSLPAPKQEKLLNGLKVLMWSDAKADKVSVKLRIHSGSAFDPQGKEGLMKMLSDNLFPSAAAREYFADELGGELRVFAAYDYIQVEASSAPDKFLMMLETLSNAVSNPAIDKETTDKLHAVLLAEIEKRETDPEFVADDALAKRLFGTFPYGRPRSGNAESLKSITFTDLIAAKQRFLTADNSTMAIFGKFDKSAAMRAIRRYFGGWAKSDRLIPTTFRQPDDPPAETLVIPWSKPDVFFMGFAFRGLAWSDKDIPASMIFSLVLQDRMQKLTNQPDVRVSATAYTLPGGIAVEIKHKLDPNSAIRFFEKSVSDPITEAEFIAAKEAALSERSKSETIDDWLRADTYKISIAHAMIQGLHTVTLAQVNAYAGKARKLPVARVLIQSEPTAK